MHLNRFVASRCRAALLAVLALSACATTRIVEKWKDPGFSGPLGFQKVVVLVISPDATVQRVAEDELVRQLGADRAMAAYTLFGEQVRGTPEDVLAAIGRNDADGLVAMRLVDTHQTVTYDRRPAEPFSSYYRTGYGYAYDRPRTTSVHVQVETRIYSVAGPRLIWTGISDTRDAEDLQGLVAEIAQAVGEELRADGLLPPEARP